ncbi:hypothetical protein [Rhizobium alvei]|uniref:Transmembrane protein n=1 Tax=Rhizobium alvei TaxID=1132659 RepID=A0ABT8YMK5_9HYPH|nr:hypothetical protein [Rhizobium alvei]MDO6964908.1 hypothetical protein [Rhizobium alvei]
MTEAQIPLWFVGAAPMVVLAGMTIAARLGLGLVLSLCLSAFALAGGVWMLISGVNASCAIDESECVGATATAYVIGFIWLMAAALSVASQLRAGIAGKLGSESTN